ncbi:MAG TPA: LD-carboxypeptidase [Vicinamibacterales bacterium]|jgi:muramoyltetrapeptide carboxypeptidase|nr:LD-carboxypeptidase [Vicinamibacterales bacterium]
MHRRAFMAALSAVPVAGAAVSSWQAQGAKGLPPVLPRRLAAGDTVGVVAPASATFQTVDVAIARESLEALGLNVKIGKHVLARHGYLAGNDKDRAEDINEFFSDSSIKAVLPIRGGWGSSRVLPHLDYDAIRRNPKVMVGYSDITALHLAIQAKTGLVTFHGPNGMGRWDAWSLDYFKRLLFDGEAVTMQNPTMLSERNALAQTENRVQTITPGTARGRVLGGNLTVLTTILGSAYVPSFDGAILFVEDVGEDFYRIDRMFTQLKLAGILDRVRGFVFGTCAECSPGEGFGSLTLEEIFADHIKPLNIPAWFGAMIGHQMPQWTIPVGVEAEIDSAKGTIRLLAPAVR